MKNEIENKLNAVFDAYQARQDAVAKADQARKSKEQENVERFYEIRNQIINPAMESIRQFLAEKGFKSRIENVDDGYHHTNRTSTSASIALKIMIGAPEYSRGSTLETPHFAATLNKADASVNFHENTISPGRGGTAGGCGSVALDDITGEMIEEKIAATLGKIFG